MKNEEDNSFLAFRRFLFWIFVASFFIFTPVIVLHSLGYKFDKKHKIFVKTGAVFIKTTPAKAVIYWKGERLKNLSPCILRDILPGEYKLRIEKKNFYPYSLILKIKPSEVKTVEVTLLPKIKGFDKADVECNVYKFFYTRHFFREKILLFTSCGLYTLSPDFCSIHHIGRWSLGAAVLSSIVGLRENNQTIIFWSHNAAWRITKTTKSRSEILPELIYKTNEKINDIFFALEGRYIIVWDGLNIIALDSRFPQAKFNLYQLKSVNAMVFYSSGSDTLYIKDKISSNHYSLFETKLSRLIYGREKN